LAAVLAYAPAMHGPFLFDDRYLPFGLADQSTSLLSWMHGVRPVLMATYWANVRISGEDTFSYHVVNVAIHLLASLLVFFVIRRLLEWAGTDDSRCTPLAAIAGTIFLLHPVQTESVAYLAGRSDSLSVLFVLAAYAVFLYRPGPVIGWGRMVALLGLFGAAMLSKEHTLVLAPLLLLTDFWWNPGLSFAGIGRNWKLYAPLLGGAALGVVFNWGLISRAGSAGFAMKDFTWYQYLFTQFRALFVYLRLFVLPYGLTLDYDFPISMNILSHGAIFGLAALLAMCGVAWRYRRQYPLASFGWFAFLLLMAPTSSILPIRDPIAERRMYLALPGLLLIAMEALRQPRFSRTALAGVLAAVCAAGCTLTYARAQTWSTSLTLWQDTVRNSPNKVRPHFQLASAYYQEGRCDEAAAEYAAAAKIERPKYDLLVDWALALDCANQPDAALAKLGAAARLEPSAHVYSQIAMVNGKQGRWSDAREALNRAERIDPSYAMIWVYRGDVHLALNEVSDAVASYRHALALDPRNQLVQQKLAAAEQRMPGAQ